MIVGDKGTVPVRAASPAATQETNAVPHSPRRGGRPSNPLQQQPTVYPRTKSRPSKARITARPSRPRRSSRATAAAANGPQQQHRERVPATGDPSHPVTRRQWAAVEQQYGVRFERTPSRISTSSSSDLSSVLSLDGPGDQAEAAEEDEVRGRVQGKRKRRMRIVTAYERMQAVVAEGVARGM